jgi:uncharacterized protein
MPSKRSLHQSCLVVYFVLAYLFSWLCLLPLVLLKYRGIIVAGPVFSGLIFMSSFGPLASASVVARWQEGTTGVRTLLAQGLRWRVHPVWYLVAVFAPPALMLLADALWVLMGGVLSFPKPLTWLVVPLNFVLVLLIGGPLDEEFGWRGYALPRLQIQYGPFRASLILGTLWAIWHLPLFFLPGTANSLLPFWLFLLQCLALTLVFTWLYNSAAGSVLLTMLFHTSINTFAGVLHILPGPGQSLMPFILTTMLLWIFAVVVVLARRGSDGFSERSTPT